MGLRLRFLLMWFLLEGLDWAGALEMGESVGVATMVFDDCNDDDIPMRFFRTFSQGLFVLACMCLGRHDTL